MKTGINLKIATILFTIFYSTTAYSTIILPLPAMIGAEIIFRSLPLVLASIFIETLLFCLFIRNISLPIKALLMACVGNAASLVGTVIMVYALTFVDSFFEVTYVIVAFILMYSGAALIELFILKILPFGYSVKQLLKPVFIGNIITYILVMIFESRLCLF